MTSEVGKLHRLYETGINTNLDPQTRSQRSALMYAIIRITKISFCLVVLSTALNRDSRQWSLLWIGASVGYLTHPNPESKWAKDTVWARVNLLWSIGPVVGLAISYPFFFDKMSFAAVFVVGMILGGEVYVWLQNKAILGG